jgi:hypothetical protein
MKEAIGWFISIVVTVSVVVFQIAMGSSGPLVTKVNTGKQRFQCELRRTFVGSEDCPVILPIADIMVSGYILYRLYPSENELSKIIFTRQGDKLVARLPNQPPSGRLEYSVFLEREGVRIDVNEGKTIIVRFLGKVPVYTLVLKSIFILLAILLSIYAGILAGLGIKTYRWAIYPVFASLLGVVFLLQPLVHKYSLNQWWTCLPNSWELGDNKLFFALIVWLLTAYYNFKKARRGLVIVSSIISILLFSVPHGFPGSTHEQVTMEIFLRNLKPLIQLF